MYDILGVPKLSCMFLAVKGELKADNSLTQVNNNSFLLVIWICNTPFYSFQCALAQVSFLF